MTCKDNGNMHSVFLFFFCLATVINFEQGLLCLFKQGVNIVLVQEPGI